MISAATHSFTQACGSAILADLCHDFAESSECAQLVEYLDFVLRDVAAVFQEDSLFLRG